MFVCGLLEDQTEGDMYMYALRKGFCKWEVSFYTESLTKGEITVSIYSFLVTSFCTIILLLL